MKYIQKRLVGSGTYAKVYLGLDIEKNIPVALKRIKLNEAEGIPATALREISTLKKTNHENVVKMLDVIHTETNLVIVMEYVQHNLHEYLEIERSDRIVANLFLQLAHGVEYIHSKHIIHRDIKPENILVSNGVLKLADFGLCRSIEIDMNTYSSHVVTLWYRPPELLVGINVYGPEIDIFSVGCVLAEMITGNVLFMADNKQHQLKTILMWDKKVSKITPNMVFQKILLECLNFDPEKRISAKELVLTFGPYLAENGVFSPIK
ncbi:putative cell division protein kinase [Dictyocoela roeselum]|nr:putative cell division protein kinase [Dictyocoela roeselum]